jgi:single-stranded-DNA-specific exonuclease
MKIIPETCFPGLSAFVASCQLDGAEIDGYKIGFTLAPRLNAAGRMGHANRGIKMLTHADYAQALLIGEALEAANKDRQATNERCPAKLTSRSAS